MDRRTNLVCGVFIALNTAFLSPAVRAGNCAWFVAGPSGTESDNGFVSSSGEMDSAGGITTSHAAVDSPKLFNGNVEFTTNFVDRGISLSAGQPSIYVELDYSPRDGMFGIIRAASVNWVDQTYPGDSVSVAVEGEAGYRWDLAGNWTGELGIARLQYPGRYVEQSPPVALPNNTEAFGKLNWRNTSVKFSYSLSESYGMPDSRGSWYLNLSQSQPLSDRWSVDVHIGRSHETGVDPLSGEANRLYNYTDYQLALVWQLPQSFSLTLAHTWTNADPARYSVNGYDLGGHHTWLTLERDF